MVLRMRAMRVRMAFFVLASVEVIRLDPRRSINGLGGLYKQLALTGPPNTPPYNSPISVKTYSSMMDAVNGTDVWAGSPRRLAAITALLLAAWMTYRLLGALRLGAWVSVMYMYYYSPDRMPSLAQPAWSSLRMIEEIGYYARLTRATASSSH